MCVKGCCAFIWAARAMSRRYDLIEIYPNSKGVGESQQVVCFTFGFCHGLPRLVTDRTPASQLCFARRLGFACHLANHPPTSARQHLGPHARRPRYPVRFPFTPLSDTPLTSGLPLQLRGKQPVLKGYPRETLTHRRT